MILADKIVRLRKKNGWSQEELAEKLGVSRQSVSKYEGAQVVPDLDKILKLSKIFGVSTDYLIKDEMEEEEYVASEEYDCEPNKFRVSMEMANDFLKKKKENAWQVAFGVMLCILSPVGLILLLPAQEAKKVSISEDAATGIGLCILLIMVAVAVVLFIMNGSKFKKYEFIEKEIIETEYGVSGMVKERQEQFHDKYLKLTVTGIVLCVCSVLPVFIGMIFTKNDFVMCCMAAILFFIVAVGVYCIIYVGVTQGAMNQLLEEEEYSRKAKKANKKVEAFVSGYWMVITAGYLGYSFITKDWRMSWIVWPIAGVLFPVYKSIINAILGLKE